MTSELSGRGLAFPIRVAEGGGLRYATGERKLRESMWLILATRPGERLLRPAFGGLDYHPFEPNDPGARFRLADIARRNLTQWEPRIDVLEVTAEQDPEQESVVLIRVAYRVRATNAAYNLVYPLYLDERAVR